MQIRTENLALTGIRGVAAAWVVLFHYTATAAVLFGTPAPPVVIASGFMGVDLFFVLSGFVLGMSYADAVLAAPRPALKRFFVSRVFRIFPLHWAVLVVFGALVLAAPQHFAAPDRTLGNFLASWFLVHEWGLGSPWAWNWPTWSLSAEQAAYLLFPALVFGAAPWLRSRLVACALAAAALGLFVSILWLLGRDTIAVTGGLAIPRCVLEFTAGYCLSRADLGALGERVLDRLFLAGVALVAAAAMWPPVQFAAPFGCALLVAACTGSRFADAAFANPAVHFLGKLSYSIYLVHALLLVTFEVWVSAAGMRGVGPVQQWLLGTAYLASVLLVSYFTWRFIELPGQSVGRALMQSRRARPAPA